MAAIPKEAPTSNDFIQYKKQNTLMSSRQSPIM